MKRRIISLTILLVLVLSSITFIPSAEVKAFSGAGSGTVDAPYIITNSTQLQEMNDSLNAYYELGNDIDASDTVTWNGGAGFVPIGNSPNPFTGNFDGQGYTIDGLYSHGGSYKGLFGWVEGNAVIENVYLIDVDIQGFSAGGLIGVTYDTANTKYITDCYVSGEVSGSYAGGLVGRSLGKDIYEDCGSNCTVSDSSLYVGGFVSDTNSYSTFYDCYATGNVEITLYGYVGGFVGWLYGKVERCFATGDVFCTYTGINYVYAGGFSGGVGHPAIGDSWIKNCYARGMVWVDYECTNGQYGHVGGFTGATGAAGGGGGIYNSYSTGEVISIDPSETVEGGFCGAGSGTISDCYWDTQTSGMSTSDGGTGKTTVQMKVESTFSGWDFDDIWYIQATINDGYPSLMQIGSLVVDTYNATEITGETFLAHGRIVVATATVNTRGFVYLQGAAGDPTLSNFSVNETGAFGVGNYSLGVSNLTPGTAYRVRAFVIDPGGDAVYGDTVSVNTTGIPVVQTIDAKHFQWMDVNERQLQGYLESQGGGFCEYRFQYGTSSGLYTYETSWTGIISTGDYFEENIDGLEMGETYYYRAQAQNVEGIGSGEEKSFTVGTGRIRVITLAASDIETTSATLNGFLEDDGGENCEYRFQYGVNPGCYIYDTTWTGNISTGDTFSQAITELTTGRTYYYRAQASNSLGIGSGDQMSFTAGEGLEDEVLSVTTLVPNDISGTYFVARGNIVTATPNAQRRGFVYVEGTSVVPTLSDNVVEEGGDFSTGIYSLLIDGLSEGTHYRVRAFAENPLTIAYGNTITVKTVGDVVIVTVDASNVALTTARLNAAVVDDGGQPVRVSFGWGTSSQSAIEDYDDYETLPGYYNTDDYPYLDVTGLTANITYYFRVEAENDVGTDLGSELTFTTGTALATPHNFIGYPYDTWISLHWAKGTNTTNSLIRYSVSTYPTSVTEGELVYLGSNTSYIHDGLTPGTTYYYSLWGESGGNVTGSYVTLMLTTHASAGETDSFIAPITPTRWLSEPDYTNLSGLGIFYNGINGSADVLNIPRGTFWMILAIVISVAIAGVFYKASKGKMMIGALALLAALVFWWLVLIVPFYMPAIALILVITLTMSKREVSYG